MIKRFVIVTGLSGAGKSSALRILEDLGYFCVDNLPVSLVRTFARLILNGNDEKYRKTALGVDIRSGEKITDIQDVLDEMRSEEVPFEILFIDASNEVIVKRYKETRRMHPLVGKKGSIEDGVRSERRKVSFLKKQADTVIDTTGMLLPELRRTMEKAFTDEEDRQHIAVTILSFGYKFGVPAEADLVFDVRFLPNPYYLEELRSLSGNDPPVMDYINSFDTPKIFLRKTTDLLKFLIPHYIEEGKNVLVIAVGCTGGRHRSVMMANELYRRLAELEAADVSVEHRDLIKDPVVKRN